MAVICTSTMVAPCMLMRLHLSLLSLRCCLPARSRWLAWVSTLIESYILSSPGEGGPISNPILLWVKATGLHCSMMLCREMTVKSAWSGHMGTPARNPILCLADMVPVIYLELWGTFSRITVAVLRSLYMKRAPLFSLRFPAWASQVGSEGCFLAPPWYLGSPCYSAIFLFFP